MSTWTDQTKNTSLYTDASKHTSSWSDANKSGPIAPAGLYYGFGPFTYSGGQAIIGNISWNDQAKH